MTLATLEPDPMFDAEARAATVDAWASLPDDATVRVWGADWCGDCRRELPALAAALDAADVPEETVDVVAVDREKRGRNVDAYGVDVVPTVVVEVGGEERARFEERADAPAPVHLANQLRE